MHLTCRCFAIALLCTAFACGPSGGNADDDMMNPDASTPDASAPPDAPSQPDAGPDAQLTVCGDGHLDAGEACDDGNSINGDGCESNCTVTPSAEIVCENLPPLSSGVCSVTAGDATKLFKGTVLTPGRVYRGGQVAVDGNGIIMCVGCDCAAQAASATVITCPKGVISPGLINTHDHITFTQNDPYTATTERYEHRHDWRKGLRQHTRIPSAGSASGSQVSWGELRFVMGGATSIVGSGGAAGLLRNLDRANQEEGLGQTAVDFQTFPLDDSSGTQLTSTCNYGAMADSESVLTGVDAYLPHVSEGIDAVARNEFLCTSSTDYDTSAPTVSHDLVSDKSAFIHGIGLNAADYALMAHDGTGLIWSPRSNITLYGNTASVTMADQLGVQIALGTDWMPTGSMNLLRELACAAEFNQKYLGGYFNDEALWKMVTVNAAALTATDDVIGLLAPGKIADITVFDGSVHDAFHAVVAAQPADVTLVVRAGKPLYGDDALLNALSSGCDSLDVCGTAKRACLQSEIGKSLAQLQTDVGADYALFACGTPPNEPTCVPSRPAAVNDSTIYTGETSSLDHDGDGIVDAADDCPTVFNPVRPLDNGLQANADLDSLGDACDPCPLDPDTTDCTLFNPDDPDNDGVLSADDNCPQTRNPDQLDSDGDHKGDLCDACPMQANPGSAACTVSIYDIKNGTVAVGSTVALANAVVTARIGNGAFLQVKEGDAGYNGPDFSGIFVFGNNTVAVGDRVDVSTATVANFFGELELTGATLMARSSGNELPAPVVVAPADIVTGGARAATLEGVLVQVADVTVASLDATPNEFIVNDGLRVDDLLVTGHALPAVGTNFARVTGVLAFRNSNSKIEYRGDADLVPGHATLAGFGPASSSVNVGESGVPTAPSPLTVSLAAAVASDTFVAVASSDESALTVVGGGVTIAAGQTSAPVRVNGLAASAGVTLTATLATVSLQASVRVIAVGQAPRLVSFTPMAATTPGDNATLTVALDLPAPAGGTVVTLALDPPSAGTIPATVTVPEGQQTASFEYHDGALIAAATVTASLDGVSMSCAITIVSEVHKLVINEIDYDNVGSDNAEFIEIFNGTASDVSLAGKTVVLVNGSGQLTYKVINLAGAGTLPAGGYLVIARSTVALPPGTLRVDFELASDNIQNGAPDGLALVDTVTGTVLDALSYEGAITSATVTGVTGPVNLVEGGLLRTSAADSNTVAGSLARLPNGSDQNEADTDWSFSTTVTPGAPNVP
jgi:large repetitive protein